MLGKYINARRFKEYIAGFVLENVAKYCDSCDDLPKSNASVICITMQLPISFGSIEDGYFVDTHKSGFTAGNAPSFNAVGDNGWLER